MYKSTILCNRYYINILWTPRFSCLYCSLSASKPIYISTLNSRVFLKVLSHLLSELLNKCLIFINHPVRNHSTDSKFFTAILRQLSSTILKLIAGHKESMTILIWLLRNLPMLNWWNHKTAQLLDCSNWNLNLLM